MENIKAGDVVVLKSGGPRMTVDYVNDDGKTAYCIWFDKNETRQRKNFFLASLAKVQTTEATSA